MADVKTLENDADVAAFLASVDNERRRSDCAAVIDMMADFTGEPAKMWGSSIVGFGRYEYAYASGRTGTMMLCGVSPRKRALTLYIMPGFADYPALLDRLGKHTTGKSCLYVNRLEDLDPGVLRELIERSVAHMRAAYA